MYCTLVFISSDGEIIGKHRKLKPTYGERFAWGEGDGSGLRAWPRPYARISGLNCWEHNMVLPGYALIADGTQVHVAAFPGYESTRQLVLCRAFASQSAAYVVLAGGMIDPGRCRGRRAARGDRRPAGDDRRQLHHRSDRRGRRRPGRRREIAARPRCRSPTIREAKALCDTAGHYTRPDVLQLRINRTPAARVVDETS